MVNDKTKAIVYPFLFGSMSGTQEIRHFCEGEPELYWREKRIVFIEDACQALGSSLHGRPAGSIGDISTLSFNANKQISGIAGGGAILTDSKEEAMLFRKLRKHGEHEVLGYNSKMLGMNAEFIDFRLKMMLKWNFQRQVIADQYDAVLKDLPVHIQKPSDGLNHTYHKYVVRFENKEIRDTIKEKIEGSGVHYPKPISEHPMYQNIKHRKDICPNAQQICDTILTLPMHPYLTDDEINKVNNIIMLSL
jgi:dTDP-4-amino-4,6-dideoxygalactose transaminase